MDCIVHGFQTVVSRALKQVREGSTDKNNIFFIAEMPDLAATDSGGVAIRMYILIYGLYM